MKASDERIQSADGSTESSQVALLLYEFARDHYHLLLVGKYKLKEIGRGVVAAIDAENEIVLFNLARAFIEHTAALAYQVAALEKALSDIPKKPERKVYALGPYQP